MSREVNTYLETKKEEYKVEIKKLYSEGSRFSIITDEWTSNNGPRFLNVCLRNNQTYNLGLVRVFGSLTAEKTVEMLQKKVHEFGLNMEKIVAICLDGCSLLNNEKGEKIFEIALNMKFHVFKSLRFIF